MNTPLFQHRHYKRIASIISSLPQDVRENVADHFAASLLGTNPNYSVHRFFSAAMGEPSNGRDGKRKTFIVGGKRKFNTLQQAKDEAQKIFDKTGDVVAIESR